ncbi:MAG: helix-turn-helix domain-containing protein [Bacilli bacterium]|nr:helix-turn-helix domain-containing protein [Bacilli bacterium]
MSFNEKLQYLRKENKLSQEQLADMLDVTRQSVSKWESGTTYPEMDKLITMCKIFKCSLDDLTNDEITEINVEKKNVNMINGIISNVSEIINKTVEMIKSMKPGQIIAMIISLWALGFLLMVIKIPFIYIEDGFYSVVSNIPNTQVVGFVSGLFNFILDIIFVILYILALVYIYKVAFLDKYEFNHSESSDSKFKQNESTSSQESNKEVKIVDNNKQKDDSIFTFLGNLVMCFIRFLVGCFALPFVFTLVMLFGVLAVSVYLFFHKIVYVGVFLSVFFSIILNIWFIETCVVFVFNKKASFKRLLWTFIIGLCGLGMGFGVFTLELSSATFVNDLPIDIEKTKAEEIFDMSPDITFRNIDGYYNIVDYEVDESLKDKVVVSASFYEDSRNIIIKQEGYYIDFQTYYGNTIGINEKYRDLLIDSLKNKRFYNFEKFRFVDIKIKSSKENIDTISRNNSKYIQEERLRDCYYQEKTIDEYEDLIDEYQERIETLNERIVELEEYKNRVKDTVGE